MPVSELLNRISSRELSEWMAYDRLQPFGPERSDVNAGIVASTVANANRDSKKRRKPFGPADFMPVFEKEKEATSWQDLLTQVEILNAAFGGVDKRQK